jgi:hypothetical protein
MWDKVRCFWEHVGEHIGNKTIQKNPRTLKEIKIGPLGWLTSLATKNFYAYVLFFTIFGLG